MRIQSKWVGLLAVLMATSVAACGMNPEPINEADRLGIYEARQSVFHDPNQKQELVLGLHDAIAYALKYNLDKRLAVLEEAEARGNVTLEKIGMLPSLDAKAEYIGRDSNRATSSISALSRTQSLEPSYSTDEHRRTMSWGVSYSLLDLGMGYYNTKGAIGEAGAAAERRRKVTQNLVQDVRDAYYRVVALQIAEKNRDRLQQNAKKAQTIIKQIEQEGLRLPTQTLAQQQAIQSKLQNYFDLYEALAPARYELAALMGLSPTTALRVHDDIQTLQDQTPPGIDLAHDDMLAIVLTSRPELMEQLHQIHMSEAELNKIIVDAFPVLGGMITGDYDENSFQEEAALTNFSLSLATNLVKLVTTPYRYNQGEAQLNYQQEKLKALSAAVITQAVLAKQRHELSRERRTLTQTTYAYNRDLMNELKREIEAELAAEIDLVQTELEAEISKLSYVLAAAEEQAAYGQFINALGINPFPESTDEMDIQHVSKAVADALGSVHSKSLKNLSHSIQTYKEKLESSSSN